MGDHQAGRAGSHRNNRQRRRVSKGPIVALVGIIVVVLVVIGWFKLRDSISDQGSAAAQTCVAGDSTLNVTADPTIAPQIEAVANRYNETKPVVRDQCARVHVTAQQSEPVRIALAAGTGWDDAALGPRPGLWIPQSSRSVHRVPAALVDGDPKSIASSPVVLAVPQPLAQALTVASAGWADLPRLAGDQNSLATIGLAGWGGLRLALPTGPGSDSTLIAVESVAAAVAGAGFGPLTEDAARSPAVVAAVSTLASTAAGKAASTVDALTALATQSDPVTGDVHAAPVTEQQLTAAKSPSLTGYAPTGSTVIADFPAALLNGDWVDETQSRTAALFVDFLRQPDQGKILADSGFRIGEPESSLIPAAGPVLDQLANTFAHPVLGANATLLLDVSASMGNRQGNRTKLANAVAAIRNHINGASDSAGLGIWFYSKDLDGTKPYRIDIPTAPLTPDRRAAIEAVLAGLGPSAADADQAYPTLQDAYRAAIAGFAPGRTNSVVLVTDGPNDDSSVTGQELLASLASAADPSKPVRVDIVVIGSGSPSTTLQTVADRTGGTLVRVPSSDSPEFAGALDKALG